MRMSEASLTELITLLSISQEVLRDLMFEDPDNDPQLMRIYCSALMGLGLVLQSTICSIATYCASYLEDVGCEGTD